MSEEEQVGGPVDEVFGGIGADGAVFVQVGGGRSGHNFYPVKPSLPGRQVIDVMAQHMTQQVSDRDVR